METASSTVNNPPSIPKVFRDVKSLTKKATPEERETLQYLWDTLELFMTDVITSDARTERGKTFKIGQHEYVRTN